MCLALLLTCFAFTAFAQLPLELKPKQRIVLIGNTLFDRMRDYGQFEAMLQQRFAKEEITVRNLAWSADEVALRPRPDGFGDLNEHLTEAKADVILAAFGFNESFKGIEAIPEFETLLKAFLIELKSHRYNGTSAPRIVLVSPTAVEDLGAPLPPAKPTNKRLSAYTESMKKVAAAEGVGFVDVLAPTLEAFAKKALKDGARTINTIHLTDSGYTLFAESLFNGLFSETPPQAKPEVRAAVEEKEKQWFYHYRPLNYFYIKGGRMEPYGVVNFPGELKKLAQMTEVRDSVIHAIAQGKTTVPSIAAIPTLPDDSKTEPLPEITGDRPINTWHSPADELKAFKIDPRFEVNCFASEEDFPDLFKKPIQIRWDAQGRLWVSTSVTYPQVYPGQAPQDQILILEDTNRDGKADKCSVWADKLQIPLSFEFGDGGVYCSEQPNLIFLKDTDGDGKADLKKVVLSGFGTEDSHHALHDFAWSPDGALIFRESIFHHSQVETPYGPVRARESSFFRFDTHTQRLQAFGSYMSTNPWGICFDDWGFHMGSHPVFAEAVHALNPAYPDQHVPAGAYFPAYSGTCGQEFLHNTHWGQEFHNHFARVRYKPTNEVELHEWVEKDSHFEEKKVGQILQSSDLSFIPVDCKCGPDGALYICDWYNPVKGHAQYSLRDTRRDKSSGRIWRVTKKGAKLQEPVKIAGEPVEKLLELLKSDDLRTRYLVRGELRGILGKSKTYQPELANKTMEWFTKNYGDRGADERDERTTLASLDLMASFVRNGIDGMETMADGLVGVMLKSPRPHIRAASTRQLRWLVHLVPNAGGIEQLNSAANDPSGLVRLEAAIAASYIGTPEALEAALDLLKHPMDEYLTYALRTALDSHTLKPHWFNNAAFMQKHPELEKFLKDSEPKKAVFGQKKKKVEKPDPFDAQAGLQVVNVSTVPERMLFTNREFHVKAKAPVKLVFENPDVTAHNLVLVQPGAADEVGLAGNEMAKDASGMAKGFIPDNPKILHHTKLLNQGDSETLRFLAPEKPGRYPYICTFPGHWLVMKGEMVVE